LGHGLLTVPLRRTAGLTGVAGRPAVERRGRVRRPGHNRDARCQINSAVLRSGSLQLKRGERFFCFPRTAVVVNCHAPLTTTAFRRRSQASTSHLASGPGLPIPAPASLRPNELPSLPPSKRSRAGSAERSRGGPFSFRLIPHSPKTDRGDSRKSVPGAHLEQQRKLIQAKLLRRL